MTEFSWARFWGTVFENYGIGNYDRLIKHFPFVDLVSMMSWKPPLSVGDVVSSIVNGDNNVSAGKMREVHDLKDFITDHEESER